jgi:hypothetical protein
MSHLFLSRNIEDGNARAGTATLGCQSATPRSWRTISRFGKALLLAGWQPGPQDRSIWLGPYLPGGGGILGYHSLTTPSGRAGWRGLPNTHNLQQQQQLLPRASHRRQLPPPERHVRRLLPPRAPSNPQHPSPPAPPNHHRPPRMWRWQRRQRRRQREAKCRRSGRTAALSQRCSGG